MKIECPKEIHDCNNDHNFVFAFISHTLAHTALRRRQLGVALPPPVREKNSINVTYSEKKKYNSDSKHSAATHEFSAADLFL